VIFSIKDAGGIGFKAEVKNGYLMYVSIVPKGGWWSSDKKHVQWRFGKLHKPTKNKDYMKTGSEARCFVNQSLKCSLYKDFCS
jgi:hypothetical protein